MDEIVRRARLALAAMVVWLIMSNLLMLTSQFWFRQRGTHFDIPIAPGRSLHIHVGDRTFQPVYGSERIYYHNSTRPRIFKPLRVSVRYRLTPGWAGRHLAVAYLPTWPLAPLMFGAACALGIVSLLPRHLIVRRA
jgi:hypothetical protein